MMRMYFQFRLSKDFERYNLMRILGFLEEWREWIRSCVGMILSRICLPSTKHVYSGEMREGVTHQTPKYSFKGWGIIISFFLNYINPNSRLSTRFLLVMSFLTVTTIPKSEF
jgi:hypothetical protein